MFRHRLFTNLLERPALTIDASVARRDDAIDIHKFFLNN
jgi:hypothetical protein